MIRAALKNPYLVLVLVLMVFIVGAVSMVRIPADLLPTYNTPAVQVVCFYPGMPPEVMEQDIMMRLERWTGQSAGIEHQEAKAMQGVCIVKDFFHPNVTRAEAMSSVTSYAMSDLFYMPPGTIPPMVMPFDPTASVPLCLVSVSNPDMNDSELYDVAYKNLRNNLQSINGVIAPAVNGGKLRRILAYVKGDKLAAHGLSILDVHEALKKQNVLIPAGSVKISDTEFYIYTNAIPDKVAALNDAPIKKAADGSQIRFRDVGEVRDSHQIQSNIVRVNGRTLVYVPVYRQPGSNTIEIVDLIKEKLSEITTKLKEEKRRADGSEDPKMKNLELAVVMDQSVKVRESITALQIAALLGALFAGLVVWLFLGDWRATLVIVLTIPISVLTSLIGLYFTGNTVNAMTLGGLALAVGILIDQAIVVIDNIERHLEMGKGSLQSAWDGTREVAIPLFVSTATFIVVFFPVLFLSGLAKYLFTPLAMSVLFAVIASYLVAMFFIPVAAAKIMRTRRDRGKEAESQLETAGETTSANAAPKELGWLVGGYRKLLLGALRMKWAVLSTALVLFVGSLFVMANTGRELFPPVDSGQFTIYVRAKSGTKLEATEALMKRVENAVVREIGDPAPDNPTADSVYAATQKKYANGQNRTLTPDEVTRAKADSNCRMLISNIGVLMDWPAAYTPNTGPMDAFLLVQMGEDGDRSVFEIVSKLREQFREEFGDDVEFAFDTGGILTAALNMGEPSPIHLQVTGYTLKTAQEIAKQLVETIKTVEGTEDVRIAQRLDYPVIDVKIDRVRAFDLGVTPEDVMKSLVSSTNSSINFDPAFWIAPDNGNHYFLGAQSFEGELNSLDKLKDIQIKSRDGKLIYLGDVAEFDTTKKVPSVINQRNITRVTDVFANVSPDRDIGSVVAEIEDKLTAAGHPLQLSPIKDSRSAASRYPEWMQRLLTTIGLNRPTKYAIKAEGYQAFTVDVQGEVRSMRDSFVDFALGLVLATMLVYLVMVAQFRSFVDPFIVMVTVPLGFIGVAAIMYLTSTRLSIQSFMGIIMMIGIVVEYTIVLLDFANHRLEEGAEVEEAIIDAAIVRFRPILMTSVTTVLALTPMAFPSLFGGLSGSEADVPLARTIVGGVIAATLLPKFVVPCLYVLIKRRPNKEEPEAGWS